MRGRSLEVEGERGVMKLERLAGVENVKMKMSSWEPEVRGDKMGGK